MNPCTGIQICFINVYNIIRILHPNNGKVSDHNMYGRSPPTMNTNRVHIVS